MDLPPGEYPFANHLYAIEELATTEASPGLETLFRVTAQRDGIELRRDMPFELRCQTPDWPDATFVVWWPSNAGRLHLLVPKSLTADRAKSSLG